VNVCVVALVLAFGCGSPAEREPAPVPAPPADRWVAEDKLRHFALSFAATQMAYAGGRIATDADTALPLAAGAALALGLAKEVRDARAGGPFSFKDLAWDAAGVALGVVLAHRIE
jgi:putative lipoprotein